MNHAKKSKCNCDDGNHDDDADSIGTTSVVIEVNAGNNMADVSFLNMFGFISQVTVLTI